MYYIETLKDMTSVSYQSNIAKIHIIMQLAKNISECKIPKKNGFCNSLIYRPSQGYLLLNSYSYTCLLLPNTYFYRR